MELTLGINMGFATNRWQEPMAWARVVREELGLSSIQLTADLIDPFWPKDALEKQLERTLAALQRYDLTVDTMMTGNHTRVNHLLHPHEEMRAVWFDWFKGFIDIGAHVGARGLGSHFGALSFTDLQDEARYTARVEEAVRFWQELSFYAKDAGLDYLFFETMSVPREMAYTVERARALYARVNEHVGVPVYLCLDAGHAPHPAERDPYPWLRALGHLAPLVHVHQTEQGHSRHWPFTPEYNRIGIVDPWLVLQALQSTGRDEFWLGLEVFHRERWEEEKRVLDDLIASADYWRQYVPRDGEWEPQMLPEALRQPTVGKAPAR